MKGESWNPWHGCHKFSAGCQNCYVYRIDSRHGKDSSSISKTADFNLPLKKKRNGEFKIPPKSLVYACFTSDFLLEEADEWRINAWKMIRFRSDLHFMFITKRIHRLKSLLPDDWGDGYDNVTIGCTMENQDRVDFRLPIFKELPIKHKIIVCEPLLERIDLSNHLGEWVERVVVGGESGSEARVCNYDWILDLRSQCMEHHVSFYFKQTGAKFVKDEKLYRVKRQFQHSQARKSGISF